MKSDELDLAVKASKAPAIARAAAVLRLLGRAESPLSLQMIARELGLVPSTCLYVLRALVEEKLVGFDPATKRYALGSGVLALARSWLRRDPFVSLAQPQLERMAREFDLNCVAVEIAGLDHIVVVAVAEGTGNFRLSTEVGSRFPALISATGRCIAASGDYPAERLRARFDTLRWDNPPALEEWLDQIEQARRDGYGVDEGHYISGVTVIAAPVRTTQPKPTHALVATGLSRTIDRSGERIVGKALKAAADGLTGQLGE